MDLSRHLFVGFLLVASLLGGCAFSDALGRGDGYAAVGDWAGAVEAYEEALALNPEAPDARARLDEARTRAAAAALASGEDALAGRRWEEALQHAADARAFRPQLPEAATLERRVKDDALAVTRRALEQDNLPNAWSLGWIASGLFPRDPEVSELLRAIWSARLEHARALKGEGRFEEALALVEELGKRHSGDATPAKREGESIRAAWAASLREQAQAAERSRQLGAAWNLYARAADLAADPADLRQRDALYPQLLREHRTTVALDFQGDPQRPSTLLMSVLGFLNMLPHPVQMGVPADLRVEVHLEPVRCDQRATTDIASASYLASTRQIPNPPYVEAQRAALQRARDLQIAEGRELEQLREVIRLQRDLDRAYDRDWKDINRRVDDAEARLTEREREREREEKALGDVQADLAHARSSGQSTSSLLSSERSALDATQRARQRVTEARRALDEEMNKLHSFRRDAQRDQERLDRARDKLASAREETLRRRDSALQTQDALVGTPPLIDEPVYAEHRYPVEVWTRTCATRALLTLHTADAPPAAQLLSLQRSTVDRAHPAHVAYNVPQDPLRFPSSDAALADELDNQLKQALHQLLRDALERRASNLLALADAALATDRPRAITLYTAHLLSGSPQRRAELIALLKRELGLNQLAREIEP